MLLFGDLPHKKPSGGFMGLHAPLSFGFMAGFAIFILFMIYAVLLAASVPRY